MFAMNMSSISLCCNYNEQTRTRVPTQSSSFHVQFRPISTRGCLGFLVGPSIIRLGKACSVEADNMETCSKMHHVSNSVIQYDCVPVHGSIR